MKLEHHLFRHENHIMKLITFKFGYLSRKSVICLYFLSFATSLGLQKAKWKENPNEHLIKNVSNEAENHELLRE